ncbi:O1052 protein, partial [Nycticryphes semicollaris]|nr:O1052 protein [Nycticryphes semicollaris]
MAVGNHSSVTEFVLLGFTELQELLFVIFLLMYITVLVGNLGMIILIRTNSQLHVPMYFFLSHLSFLDVCCSSSIVPKLLSGLLAERNVISFNGCIIQFFFFAVLGTTEAILLAVMAYDRYVAICEPLHYLVAMPHEVCVQLVVFSYAAGSVNALVHTSSLLQLTFCGPNLINHFYCEMPPLLLLSCSDTRLNELVMATCVGLIITTSVLAIVVSYACILLTIWSIHSAEGRHKAFSTCTSHLLAVALFYGSASFLYFHPFPENADQGKTASLFYTLVTPMLNPFIYSLRNKEVRSTLRRAMNKLLSCLY